jgi:hypothetical protein
MKVRAWILAATIAAATGFLTTAAPAAQACVINPDGECLTAIARGHPSAGLGENPTKPTARARARSIRSKR